MLLVTSIHRQVQHAVKCFVQLSVPNRINIRLHRLHKKHNVEKYKVIYTFILYYSYYFCSKYVYIMQNFYMHKMCRGPFISAKYVIYNKITLGALLQNAICSAGWPSYCCVMNYILNFFLDLKKKSLLERVAKRKQENNVLFFLKSFILNHEWRKICVRKKIKVDATIIF